MLFGGSEERDLKTTALLTKIKTRVNGKAEIKKKCAFDLMKPSAFSWVDMGRRGQRGSRKEDVEICQLNQQTRCA